MVLTAKSNKFSQLEPCIVCNNRNFRFLFTKKRRKFWRCNSCGLEVQHPLPTLEELADYYNSSYAEGLYKVFVDASQMKRLTAQQRYGELKKFCPPGTWLDVGCADGIFVEYAQAHGLRAEGIELSEIAVHQAQRRNLAVHCSTLEDWKPNYTYDTITAFDVIEHVLDPQGFLLSARSLLSPGGMLVLTLPDQDSIFRKLMRQRWYFYIPEEHLHYFNPKTIERLLEKTGFKLRRCSWTYKPLTYRYALTQFKEYNPLIYKILNFIAHFIPSMLLDKVIPLYIGEMMVIAEMMVIP